MGSIAALFENMVLLSAGVSAGWHVLACVGMQSRESAKAQATTATPISVSILKPCAGVDDGLEACIESFCRLKHPRYELLCGVRTLDDPAVDVLERVRQRHPEVDFRIIETREGVSANPKVAQLEILEQYAQYDALWISDSNTWASPDLLQDMCALMEPSDVGLVVSPVVGVGERTVGSALENLYLGAFVSASTYALWALLGMVAAPGKSALLRRTTWERMGGMRSLGNYLAEDHLLVERVRSLGERVVLGRVPVQNWNTSGSVFRAADRHARWSRLRWVLAPVPTALEGLLAPAWWALLALLCQPELGHLLAFVLVWWSAALADLVLTTRMRGHSFTWKFALVSLLRPWMWAYTWGRSIASRRVVWRGSVRWIGPHTTLLTRHPLRARLDAWREALR